MVNIDKFKEGFKAGAMSLNKADKKEASLIINNLIGQLNSGFEINPQELGNNLARLESYFHVGLINKRDPILWCLTALDIKDPKRGYVKLAKYVDDIGFVCTDSKRLHIYDGEIQKKIEEQDMTYFHPLQKVWITDEQAEELGCQDYPDVQRIINVDITDYIELVELNFSTLDKGTVYFEYKLNATEFMLFKNRVINSVKDPVTDYIKDLVLNAPEKCPEDGFICKVFYEKKYFNQALSGMENPKFFFKYGTPLVITSSNNRKAIIMEKFLK